MKFIIITIIIFFLRVPFVFAESYEKFEQDFINASEKGLSKEELNNIFATYTKLIFPNSNTSRLINKLKGQKIVKFPIAKLKTKPFYSLSINKLLNSEDPNARILSYITLGSANDSRFNDILRARLKSEKNKGNKLWACVALLYLEDNHTTELFDFLVENEDFGDTHLVPLFINLEKSSLKKTAYDRINSDNKKAKILAVQILSVTDLTPETEVLVKNAVETWEFKMKGYAIFTMKALKMGHLKTTLAPLLNHEASRAISLEALANSPTPEDRDFLFSLHAKMDKIPEDILDAYFNSKNINMIERWLQIIKEQKIPEDYVFYAFKQPLLASNQLLIPVRDAIRKSQNVKVLQELPRVLEGRKDDESIDLLISLMTHHNSTVRYWAAFSLKSITSPKLVSILPSLLNNPNLRTVALTELLITNKMDKLQNVFEKFWEPGKETSRDWRRTSIQYLSTFP